MLTSCSLIRTRSGELSEPARRAGKGAPLLFGRMGDAYGAHGCNPPFHPIGWHPRPIRTPLRAISDLPYSPVRGGWAYRGV